MKSLVVALVKLQALVLLFDCVIALSYFSTYYRALNTPHGIQSVSDMATQSFFAEVLRVVLYFSAGVLLFINAERVVDRLRIGVAEDRKDAGTD